MTLSSLLLYAGTLFLVASVPGPSITALVARVLSRGYRDVLPFVVAMWLGEAVWLSLAIGGLSVVASSFASVFAVIKWLGCGYLVYMAYRMWASRHDVAEEQVLPTRKSGIGMFLAGFAVTMGNPKIMLFYAALLPTLIDLGSVTTVGWFELMVTMLITLATVDLGWVFFASKARLLLKSPRAVRIANRTGAVAMAGAAAAIVSKS
ncbi:LysE family translocator [Cohaesibacter haloalkalitolerans]|uniref:LysE family translocator n=1 Tax=Cohaesibacter haloalkalitolerans TaxID=1162980 RepID=UPI000E64FC03|nr:LysE family translocator [Cohaesibacter haloalkalitolerans]